MTRRRGNRLWTATGRRITRHVTATPSGNVRLGIQLSARWVIVAEDVRIGRGILSAFKRSI